MGNLAAITRARLRNRHELTRPERWLLISPGGAAVTVDGPGFAGSHERIRELLELPESAELGSYPFGVQSTLWFSWSAQQDPTAEVNGAASKALEIHVARGVVVRGTVLVHHQEATMPRQRGRW